MQQIQYLRFFIFILGFVFSSAEAAEPIWVLVDTTNLRLEVKQANQTLLILDNIAIGQNGAGFKQHRGDDITPLGTYKIGWINDKSRFHTFYGFNYPSIKNAGQALLGGLLNEKTYNSILKAHRNEQVPPQNTHIGGQIGIHGLGKADIRIHKMMNWTHGCIALTNEQIDMLAKWLKEGTLVKVK